MGQNVDNWEDDPFSWFEQFIDTAYGSPLQTRGNSNQGLDKFFEAAHYGTPPQFSYIISDQELTEICLFLNSKEHKSKSKVTRRMVTKTSH